MIFCKTSKTTVMVILNRISNISGLQQHKRKVEDIFTRSKNRAYSIEIYGAYSIVIKYLCINDDTINGFPDFDVKTK